MLRPVSRGVWCLLVGAYLCLPTLLVVLLSFEKGVIRWPPDLWSLHWYGVFLHSSDWTGALFRSLVLGLVVAAASALIGSMAAYSLIRGRYPLRGAIEALALAPLILPPIVLATGGYSLFSSLHLVGSYIGLGLLHTVLGVPFVVLTVSAALARVDSNLELASASLGAGRVRTFWHVVAPVILPAVLTGALFAFLQSFDEVVVAVFLVSGASPTLPVYVFSQLTAAISPVVAVVSTVQVLIALFALAQLGVFRRWSEHRIRATARATAVTANNAA